MKILQATGLPQHLSNFVFCQYHFWDQSEAVFIAPEVNLSAVSSKEPQSTVIFNNCKVKHARFSVSVLLRTQWLKMCLCVSVEAGCDGDRRFPGVSDRRRCGC